MKLSLLTDEQIESLRDDVAEGLVSSTWGDVLEAFLFLEARVNDEDEDEREAEE